MADKREVHLNKVDESKERSYCFWTIDDVIEKRLIYGSVVKMIHRDEILYTLIWRVVYEGVWDTVTDHSTDIQKIIEIINTRKYGGNPIIVSKVDL